MNQTYLVVDYWWTFALPFICLCSVVTSALSLLILNKLRHLNRLYLLLFVKTLINMIYLSICFWIFLVKCGHLCPPASNSLTWSLLTFGIQIYKHYIYGYIGSVLACSDLLIEIMLSIERFKLTNNNGSSRTPPPTSRRKLTNAAAVERKEEHKQEKWYKSFGLKIVFVLASSTLIYLPSLFFIRLVLMDRKSSPWTFSYRLQTANAKLDERIRMLTTVFLRSLPTLVLVVFINVINVLYIKRRGDKVCTRTSNTIATRKLKRMLFYQSLLFILGNSPLVVSHAILFAWPDGSAFLDFRFLPLVNNTLLFASLGLNYFLWVRYDQRFGQTSKKLITTTDENIS